MRLNNPTNYICGCVSILIRCFSFDFWYWLSVYYIPDLLSFYIFNEWLTPAMCHILRLLLYKIGTYLSRILSLHIESGILQNLMVIKLFLFLEGRGYRSSRSWLGYLNEFVFFTLLLPSRWTIYPLDCVLRLTRIHKWHLVRLHTRQLRVLLAEHVRLRL